MQSLEFVLRLIDTGPVVLLRDALSSSIDVVRLLDVDRPWHAATASDNYVILSGLRAWGNEKCPKIMFLVDAPAAFFLQWKVLRGKPEVRLRSNPRQPCWSTAADDRLRFGHIWCHCAVRLDLVQLGMPGSDLRHGCNGEFSRFMS